MKLKALLICAALLTLAALQVSPAMASISPQALNADLLLVGGTTLTPASDNPLFPISVPRLEIRGMTANPSAEEIQYFLEQPSPNGGGLTFDGLAALLYKRDASAGNDAGPFAGSYTTSFTPSNDPLDSLLSHVSGQDSFDSSSLFLLLKDGNHDPSQYLFNISNWDRTSDLRMEDFWPRGGAISHISIYGGTLLLPPPPPPPTGGEAPEAASLAIWALLAGAVSLVKCRSRFVG